MSLFGIKINWDVLKEKILVDFKRKRTTLERVANIASFIIGLWIGHQIALWIMS